jgi:hypothetical protein
MTEANKVDKPTFNKEQTGYTKLGQTLETNQAEVNSIESAENIDISKGLKGISQDFEETKVTDTKKLKADDSKESSEEGIPKALLNKYYVVDDKYHFKGNPEKVAFEDSGKALKTTIDDKHIAASMVEVAKAKKWETIQVKGSEEFKRNVWLEASMKGMTVKGYEPRDIDLALLNDMKKEQGKEVAQNTIEKGTERQKEKPINEKEKVDPAQECKEKLNNLSEQEKALLTVFDKKMKADGFTEKQRTASIDVAVEQLNQKKMHVGKLVDHGAAPYKHNPKNSSSYYATIENSKGEKNTVWAKDLERTLKEQNIIKNDDIVLTYKGSNKVEVNTKEIDPKTGLPTGARVQTLANKGKWEAQSLSKLKETTEKALTKNDKTKLQIQHNADIQNEKLHRPKLTAYAANAPTPQPQVKTQERNKNKDISR